MVEAVNINVSGVVQGVGFRPFIYAIAQKYACLGWVLNSKHGVEIHAEATPENIDKFTMAISAECPSAAIVKEITILGCAVEGFSNFEIRFSDCDNALVKTFISPDLGICSKCASELFDKSDKRYKYPFINCTNCGPRFTIIKKLPYDRCNTSMSDFEMCKFCADEYDSPTNRRFHAQPNACFDCGPAISWLCSEDVPRFKDAIIWGDNLQKSEEIVERAVAFLREGKILAVKGLGGFHLVCDATNDAAVTRLRNRKQRPTKPLACMFKDLEHVKQFFAVNEAEKGQLESAARPIVLLRGSCGKTPAISEKDVTFVDGDKANTTNDTLQSDTRDKLARTIADGLGEIGAMLPATPLQLLLASSFGKPMVMTSGNKHGSPIFIDDTEAFEGLKNIADAFIGNNREILTRFDDSVVRVISGADDEWQAVQFIRRARGYAPLPIELSSSESKLEAVKANCTNSVVEEQNSVVETEQNCILAAGSQQKSTFTFLNNNYAFVSSHIGDLENAENFDSYLQSLEHSASLLELKPKALAYDMHPEYLSTKWAKETASKYKLSSFGIWHHHAHIASVMSENELSGPVLGFAFDGTGYGADGNIWGGEALLCNLHDFERLANFAYFPLIGGSSAVKHIDRCAYGALWNFDLLEHDGAKALVQTFGDNVQLLQDMLAKSINCPRTSSVGRLFDAACAILGLKSEVSYEGEGAILLEGLISKISSKAELNLEYANAYEIAITKNAASQDSCARDTSILLLDPTPCFAALLDDLCNGTNKAIISVRFHFAFVNAILAVASFVRDYYGLSTVALAGGVFMNRFLIENTIDKLYSNGFDVAISKNLPPNDGSVSHGQVVIANSMLLENDKDKGGEQHVFSNSWNAC